MQTNMLWLCVACAEGLPFTVRIDLAGEAQDSAWGQGPLSTLARNERPRIIVSSRSVGSLQMK